jgi:hypothetical protein
MFPSASHHIERLVSMPNDLFSININGVWQASESQQQIVSGTVRDSDPPHSRNPKCFVWIDLSLTFLFVQHAKGIPHVGNFAA